MRQAKIEIFPKRCNLHCNCSDPGFLLIKRAAENRQPRKTTFKIITSLRHSNYCHAVSEASKNHIRSLKWSFSTQMPGERISSRFPGCTCVKKHTFQQRYFPAADSIL